MARQYEPTLLSLFHSHRAVRLFSALGSFCASRDALVRSCVVLACQCDGDGEATYKAFRALAWFFFLVYPLGVPCFFFCVLHLDYAALFDVACT